MEHTPDIAAEQTIETEVPVPVGIVEVRTRRNSNRSSRNIIGPGETHFNLFFLDGVTLICKFQEAKCD